MDFFFFFNKIHLPFWPLQSQEEHPVPCVAKTPVIALGPTPLLVMEPSAPASEQFSVASQSCRLAPQQNSVSPAISFSVLFWDSRTTFC